jgi:hypothetical protein
MKITFSLFSLLLCLSFLSACGNPQNAAEKEPETAMISKVQDPCLITKREKLSDALTPDMIEKYTEGKEYEMDDQVLAAGKGAYNNCQYSWAGEGTRKVSMGSMSVDVPNRCHIQLGMVKWVEKDDPVGDFNNVYKTVTEEDMKKLKEEFKKQMDKREELSDQSKEPGKKLGGGLLDEMNKTNFEDVSGLGDAAKWETSLSKMSTPSSGVLHVQLGNERFNLDVDLGGEDSSKSKAAAIEIAKKIIAGCK